MWNEIKPSAAADAGGAAKTIARIGSAGKPIKSGARIGEENKTERADGKAKTIIITVAALPVLALATLARTGGIYGFGAGIMLAFVLLKTPVSVLIEYCLVALLLGGSVAEKAAGLFGAGIAAALNVAIGKKKYAFPIITGSVFLGAAGCAFIPDGNLVIGLVSAFVTAATGYAAFVAFRPVLSGERGTKTERGCQAIMLAILALGASGLKAGGFDFSYAMGLFSVACVSRIYGAKESVIAAFCVGLGASAYDFSVYGIAFFVLVGAANAFFSSAPRLIGVAASVMAAVGFKLYFNVDCTDTLWVLAAIAAGGAAYCVIPQKAFDFVSVRVAEPPRGYDGLLVEGELARTEEYLKNLASAFDEMSKAFVETRDDGNFSAAVFDSTRDICDNCGKCKAAGFDYVSALDKLCEASVRKGRAEITDVPFLCQTECKNAAKLIKRASDSVYELAAERNRRAEIEKERNVVAKFASLTADILSRAAKNSVVKVGSAGNESTAEEELLARGVNVRGIMTAGERVNVVAADCDEKVIADVFGKVYGSAYDVKSIRRAGGIDRVTLTPRPAFDAVVGASTLPAVKGASGDGYSTLKLGGDKLMIALCDGMGRGREAKKTSERAISLIENFYRAGFDHEFIISAVNRFLAFGKDESFSAFDVLVLDLSDLSYTLVKLASPASFVRSGDDVFMIEGNSLPLGSPCPVTPTVYRGEGKEGDVIMLCTDGVTDALGLAETGEILKTIDTTSPRTLSDYTIEAASARVAKGDRDDMTAVSVRLMRRV